MQTIALPKLGEARLSENGNYLIISKNTQQLYVKSGLKDPRYCLLSGQEPIKYSGATYNAYAPQRQFLRDCLHSAEEIIHEGTLDTGQVRSKVAGVHPDLRFGVDDAKNISAAQAHHANEAATPAIGQAYVIVATDNKATYPYHAAAVAAQDGQDQVTIEIFARETDASRRNATGTFDMYTIGDANLSFHGRWKTLELFGKGSAPLTIVIERL